MLDWRGGTVLSEAFPSNHEFLDKAQIISSKYFESRRAAKVTETEELDLLNWRGHTVLSDVLYSNHEFLDKTQITSSILRVDEQLK